MENFVQKILFIFWHKLAQFEIYQNVIFTTVIFIFLKGLINETQ